MQLFLLTRDSPSLLSHAVFLSLTHQTTLLFLISGLCLGGDVLSPGPVNRAVGGNVWINTTIRPADKPLTLVIWKFNGSTVITFDLDGIIIEQVYRDRVRLDNHTGSLELLNVTVSDSGQYTVTIKKTDEDPEMKGAVQLFVFEKISGVSLTGPAQPLIEDQSSANLTCEGTGSIITTGWMKDGQPLSPSNSIIFLADLRSVSISPVRRSDSGEYQCRLSNPVSSDTATYTMTVHYGPENVAISGQSEVEVGSNVTLTCSAESTPPASFNWMLNGREIGETTASYSKENVDSTHSGNYTCTAWNNVTSLTMSVHHHLTVPDKRLFIVTGVIIGAFAVFVIVFFKCYKQRTSAERGGNEPSSSRRRSTELKPLSHSSMNDRSRSSEE